MILYDLIISYHEAFDWCSFHLQRPILEAGLNKVMRRVACQGQYDQEHWADKPVEEGWVRMQ